MTIDSSIALGVKPVQIDSPINALAQMYQIKAAQQQSQAADMTMQGHQRTLDDSNKLRSLFSAPGFDMQNPDSLKQVMAISPTQGMAMQKAQLDGRETQGKIAKQQVDLIDAKLKQSREYLATVRTPEEYLAWHEANHRDPVLGPELSARGVSAEQARASIMAGIQQPGGFEEMLKKSALGIEKFVEMNKPTVHMQNLGGTSQVVSTPGMGGAPTVLSSTPMTQSPESVATERSAAAARAQSAAQFGITQAAGKVPAGYRAGLGGTLAFIPGGPADPNLEKNKPLTETQGKATGFAARMQDSDKIISLYDGKVSPAAVAAVGGVSPSWLPGGGMINAATNSIIGMRSPEAQLYQQAQENWVTANLRLESGAVIGDVEKENEVKKWFPQAGDMPGRIAQKAAARKVAERSMVVQAGPGSKQIAGIVNGPVNDIHAQADAILKGAK